MNRLLFAHLLISFFICNSAIFQEFGARVDMGIIESNDIVEASGIAASRKNPGFSLCYLQVNIMTKSAKTD